MNPKIKLRRSTSTAGKKLDAGEPMFDLTSGKLYISKADNKTIGTDAEVVEIGGGGGVPDNIECVSVTTTPSGSGTKSGKIVLNNALNTPVITLDGNTGNISAGGNITSTSTINSADLNASNSITVGGNNVIGISVYNDWLTNLFNIGSITYDSFFKFQIDKNTSSPSLMTYGYPSYVYM